MPSFSRILVIATFMGLSLSACHTISASPTNPHNMIAMTADDDQDGVLNETDACPTTALNEPVDARGCNYAIIEEIEYPTIRLYFPKNQSYPYDAYDSLTQKPDKIREYMQKILQLPLDYLKNHPAESACIFIEGHSSKGKYGDTIKNIDLRRALTLKQMYKEWFGFDEKNIKVEYYGAERPISPSDTPEHTARNQRVYSIVTGCR